MPQLYYTTEMKISEKGEKYAQIHLDSNYLVCYFFSTNWNNTQHNFKIMDHRTRKVFDDHCNKTVESNGSNLTESNNYTTKGKEMYDWLQEVMEGHAKDSKIVFKGVVLHHPMFGLYYNDYMVLVNRFLPKLRKFGYDLYISGLEH